MINMLAFTLFVQALKVSPLSLTFPFLAFTPVFLIFTSYFLLGELPGLYGIAGIVLVTCGAYVLNLDRIKEGGILAPFMAIKDEKGSVLMLIVSVLWSFAASLDKVALLASSPFFYILAFHMGFFLLYLPFLVRVNPVFLKEVKDHFPMLCILGVFEGLLVVFQMTALKVALVSYVIAIKRSGMIFTLIMGWLFFREKLSFFRVLGTVMMVFGVCMIVIFS